MTKVWFNHWFSTSYGLIQLMKKDAADVSVIASNLEINSVIQKVCDEWYQEPNTDGEDYIAYCLDFCKEHQVDVFVPRRKMVEISRNKARFQQIGVAVMVDDWEKIEPLNDKAATYQMLSRIQGVNIPDYAVVHTPSQFKEAYARLKEKHDTLCVKFAEDEGAMSYRRIVENITPYRRLKKYQSAEVDYAAYVNALESIGTIDDLMIMPFLSGAEVSVDCLKTSTGIIAIPRAKSSSRHEEILFDPAILEMTRHILEFTDLEQPCNVQFRYENGIPYLLEINTRMSGGLQMSCLGTGVNIPKIALYKLLGQNLSWDLKKQNCTVSYIEIPQLIP